MSSTTSPTGGNEAPQITDLGDVSDHQLLHLEEAGDFVGVPALTVFMWLHQGRLQAFRIGGSLHFDPMELLQARDNPTAEPIQA